MKGTTVGISAGWIQNLRKKKDFSTAIKVGRVLNALLFAVGLSRTEYGTSPVGQRNGHRAVLVMAGHTYEALIFFASLETDYASESFFSKARVLLADRSRWKVAEKLRNRSGFHLDHDDEITTETLKLLKDKNYDLYSAGDLLTGMTLGEYYFNLADEINTEYFNVVFKKPTDKNDEQTSKAMITSLGDLAKEVAFAALDLHQGLLAKLGLVAEIGANETKDD